MPRSKYTRGKDGRWRTNISTGRYDDNGKLITIRLSSSKSSSDLERQVEEVRYKLRHKGTITNTEVPLFKDYADKWLATKEQRSIKTYEMYDNIMTNHLQSFYDTPLDMIRQSDIQLLIKNNYIYPRTCEQIVLTLRQIFDMAVNDDLILKNPCRNIELPRHVKEEKRPLTESEKETIKNAEGLSEFQRAYIHLLYGSGMRPAEMYALTWQDIDFENGSVTINKALQFTNSRIASVGLPKTNKSIRTIPLPDFVITSISALKSTGEHLPTETIFGAKNGDLRTRSAYRNIFDVIMHKLKLKDITPYMMRHNFCTQCYRDKVDIKTCQYLMGHSDTKMVLEVYTHIEKSDQTLRVEINKLNF